MISKEIFVKLIDAIKREDERCDKESDAFQILLPEVSVIKISELQNELIEILEKAFNCGDLISWWLFEDVEKVLYEADTNKVYKRLDTTEDLYDYLVSISK